MNKIILNGNITRDPEIQTLSSGKELTTFSIAVNRKFRKDDGTYDTDFFNCTAFGKLGTDVIAKYSKKGQRVLVVGRMESNTKENNGSKTTYWNVVVDEFELLGNKSQDNEKPKMQEVDDNNLPF